jgi:hypothetical protein
MSYTKIRCYNAWTSSNISVRCVSKVAPRPQVIIHSARWHCTRAGVTITKRLLCESVWYFLPRRTNANWHQLFGHPWKLSYHRYSKTWTDISFSARYGTTLHFEREVISYLSHTVVAWIGRGGTIAWPPRLSELASLDFSVWGYVHDTLFAPPLSASLVELRARITEAIATTNVDRILWIREETAYRWDIYCVTRGNSIWRAVNICR